MQNLSRCVCGEAWEGCLVAYFLCDFVCMNHVREEGWTSRYPDHHVRDDASAHWVQIWGFVTARPGGGRKGNGGGVGEDCRLDRRQQDQKEG